MSANQDDGKKPDPREGSRLKSIVIRRGILGQLRAFFFFSFQGTHPLKVALTCGLFVKKGTRLDGWIGTT